MATATAITIFEPFNEKEGDIDCYLERLHQYFIAVDIKIEDNTTARRKGILLSSIGRDPYKTLKDICFPASPNDKTYDELVTLLKGHYRPKRVVVGERFKFHSAKQNTGESINDYATRLKQLSIHCEFTGDQLKQNLRDRFICGLHSESTQKKLLAKTYTFDEALTLALAEETASKNVTNIGTSREYQPQVNRVGHKYSNSKPQPVGKKCDRCGLRNHSREECRHKNAVCFRCNKVGHLKSQCRGEPTKPVQKPTTKKKFKHKNTSRGQVRYVNQDDEFVDSVFTVDAHSQEHKAIKIPIKLENTKIEMELDTGASVSVMNVTVYNTHFKHIKLIPVERKLHAYTGAQLDIAGKIEVNVDYEGQKALLPIFVINADKYAPPLLGRDWLHVIKLDWHQLLPSGQYTIRADSVEKLKDKYSDIFQPELGTVQGVKASLHIKDDVTPVFYKPRPVPFSMRPAVENELERMQNEGIIKPVEVSEWATPLVCVPKTDGSVRLCGDYKVTVNKVIQTDQYPVPTPEEVFNKMTNGEKFSKIDLKCAYQQMLLDEKSQELVTINTHKGMFRYTRLPFGISSSPAIWQRFIDQVLAGLEHTCAIMDDVLVSGRDDDEHIKNLENVFERFRKYGLRLKAEKCIFMQPSVVYMGRRISKDGIQPTDDKVEAIRNAPVPRDVSELRSWLGMVNFQAKFVPNLSTMAHPLNELLGNKTFDWTPECDEAFMNLKQAISSDNLLAHYNPDLPLILVTDASPYGVGATIMHEYQEGMKRRPIAYASRSLNKAEQGYSQLDKEALAVMFGVKKFETYLYGRKFVIMTDNKPLERIFGSKTGIPTLAAQRLQRWAITLSAFDYEIKYMPGKDNVFADALSRLPLPTQSGIEDDIFNISGKMLENLPVTSREIQQATRVDPVLSRVLEFTKNGWPTGVEDLRLKPYFNRRYELSVEQDCVLWGLRVIIPEKYQSDVLGELHIAHPGIVRMKEIARSYVWWPGMDLSIEQTVRNCQSCQQVRNPPMLAPLTPWMWPGEPWQRIHVDFAEKDKNHYLVVVDAYSKWPEIFSMKSTTTEATINVLRTLFSRYGIVSQLVSDNGPQFRSEEFAYFLRMNGVKHVKVSPYHPASNGAAERMVQSFKRGLSVSKNDTQGLQTRLDRFLLSYRSTTHATTGCTPAKLFMGRELRTRLSLIRPDLKTKVMNKQSDQKHYHDKSTKYREFYTGDQVLVKDVRENETWWPGTIVERSGPKSYVVMLNDGRVWKRHVDLLRKMDIQGFTDQLRDTRETKSVDHSETVTHTIPQPDVSQEVPNEPQHTEDVTNETIHIRSDPPMQPQSPAPDRSIVTTTPRRSGRQRKAPDRLIESV